MATNPFAKFVEPQENPFAQFVESVALETPVQRKPVDRLTQFGRGAASLADITLGSIIPGAIQYGAYPFLRVAGRTPEQATASTQAMTQAVDQPFGKTFGVTETPEYKQESSRQLMDFIGRNVQKGTNWLAQNTGLPIGDVESIVSSLAIGAPSAAKQVAKTAAPIVEQAKISAQLPFEPMLQARRERLSAESYAKAPQLDAAAEAQRLKLVIDPTNIDPSAKFYSALAGPRGPEALTAVNRPRVTKIAKDELGVDSTTSLTSSKPFNQVRANLAGPYDEIRKLPIQQADAEMIQRLEAVRSDLDVIGANQYAPAISKIVDDAISKTQAGLTGEKLLKNISVLRNRAKMTYNNKAATTEALDIADTNLKIAAELESMIDSSIADPKLLERYRDARQKMARTYAYEGATDFNTGMVDVSKLARITSKDNALTGDIASLGQIAGNFPEAFSTAATSNLASAPRLTRTGTGATGGAVSASLLGFDPITGAVVGGLLGELGGAAAASRMASPSYQAGLKLRDYRIPVKPVSAVAEPIPKNRAVVPYQTPIEVLQQGEGTYFPNFVMRPNDSSLFTTPGVAPGPAQIGMTQGPVGGQMGALRMEDVRVKDLSMRQGAQAEAQQAAAEAAARPPTSGGSVLDFDPITGKYKVGGAGIKGATPEIFMETTGKSLISASEKIAAGKLFDMTAAEKVAWDRTKVDLAVVAPELKGLSDKAVAAKMMDREWIANTISNLREKDRIFNELSQKSAQNRVASDAANKAKLERELMLNQLMELQDNLRPSRPVQKGGQGPKTRAFQQNMLTEDSLGQFLQDNIDALNKQNKKK